MCTHGLTTTSTVHPHPKDTEEVGLPTRKLLTGSLASITLASVADRNTGHHPSDTLLLEQPFVVFKEMSFHGLGILLRVESFP